MPLLPFILLASTAMRQGSVQLAHTYIPGLASEYSVAASVETEERSRGLSTFLPSEEDISYHFFTKVLSVTGGIATIKYSRPKINVTEGATVDKDPVTTPEKLNQIVQLTLSPINEVLDAKDQTPKKKPATSQNTILKMAMARSGASKKQIDLMDFIAPFIQEMEQLCVFIGSFDSSLDLAPKLDLAAVKPGDTWKRTIGYQPQKLGSKTGKTGKTVVQRLDLTYTYKGLVDSHSKKVQRIQANVSLDTDIANYLNEMVDATSAQTGIKTIPMKYNASIDFDLDPKTLQTLSATLDSNGSFKIFVTAFQDPLVEENIKGSNILTLLHNTVAKPISKK